MFLELKVLGKHEDGRYKTAKLLSIYCRHFRACRHCEGEWRGFNSTKADYLYDFEERNARQIRQIDPNWQGNN